MHIIISPRAFIPFGGFFALNLFLSAHSYAAVIHCILLHNLVINTDNKNIDISLGNTSLSWSEAEYSDCLLSYMLSDIVYRC